MSSSRASLVIIVLFISKSSCFEKAYNNISAAFINVISNAHEVIRLYQRKAPGSENWTQKESEFTYPMLTGLLVRNVTDPFTYCF